MPSHTQCPCLPDQPLLGANRDGVFIATNEFQNNAQIFFNGGQIYGLGRAKLESGASSVKFVHLNVGTVPTRDQNLPFWDRSSPRYRSTRGAAARPNGNGAPRLVGGAPRAFIRLVRFL